MTYPTCKTCKHWRRESYYAAGYGACEIINEGDEQAEIEMVGSYGDVSATLMVRDDFGCIKHEAKE